jgi:hypothetical protein
MERGRSRRRRRAQVAARHVSRSHEITIDAPIADVFPLFTPAGEELWVEGWKPDYLHPDSGETRRGMIFTTGQGAERTIWSVADYDPERHVARYVRVTPASRFGYVDIACEPAGTTRTRVRVAYTYTALTESGNGFIERFTEESYRQMIEEWRELIGAYLERTRRA